LYINQTKKENKKHCSMKLFGRASGPAPKEAGKQALQKLQETLLLLQGREDVLHGKIHRELVTAKQNSIKNKRAALAALQRKKLYDGQLATLEGTRLNIEQQIIQLENMNMASEMLSAMKTGSSAMKQQHEQMKPDEVASLMDEIGEQATETNELQQMLSQDVGGEPLDEDALEQELAALELEDQALQDSGPPSYAAVFAKLPPVPTTELRPPSAPVVARVAVAVSTKPAGKEDEDFSKLAANMN
jgi:charged multivesicular body protein 4